MIPADRFVVDKLRDEEGWLFEHGRTISATAVAKAATPSGFTAVVESWGEHVEPNLYMQFGTMWEPFIAGVVKRDHAVMPNDWLIRSEVSPLYTATPDGLTLDHTVIGEYKTTGKDWDTPPIQYRRQVQWQLFVTSAERCVFSWLLRDENFQPGWDEPKTLTIERDEKEITKLVGVADRLIKELGLNNGR